jgi:hypothetical protein
METKGMPVELAQRYFAAMHAMQTAVKVESEAKGDFSREHKHLRVGINSAMGTLGTLVELLIDKGVLTEQEYFVAVVKGAEQEAERCAKIAREAAGLPDHVKFE